MKFSVIPFILIGNLQNKQIHRNKTDSGARQWAGGSRRLLTRYSVSFRDNEDVLGLHSGDGCIALGMD